MSQPVAMAVVLISKLKLEEKIILNLEKNPILNDLFFFYSEPAASVGSDDESNAATDGSTLRTPAEPAGSSESGGSGVESIGGASGRSSTCDQMHSSPPRSQENVEIMPQPEPSTSQANIQEEIREEDSEDNNEAELIHKLHVLR